MDKFYKDFFNNELDGLKENDQYRFFKNITKEGNYALFNNKRYLNLSSNDYLGLASDKKFISDFYSKLNKDVIDENFLPGSTSSRLLTGDYPLYYELEDELKRLYDSVSDSEGEILVFNSGYHANIGIISSIVSRGDLILSDKLNHASIIDGMRLSGCDFLRYKHLDYDHLESILEKKREKYNKVLIITESVFSMDGDTADINRLIEIKKKYNSLLYVDEAHAFGVFGENGLGLCEEQNCVRDCDIIVGTFGKAAASIGAYAYTDRVLKEFLINKMRTLIFTTSLPPININWNLHVVKNLHKFNDRRIRLKDLSTKLRESFRNNGIVTGGNSQIVPAVIGENDKTLKISEKLMEENFLLFAIRPPTVPPKTSRIRISLTSEIEWNSIKEIGNIIKSRL